MLATPLRMLWLSHLQSSSAPTWVIFRSRLNQFHHHHSLLTQVTCSRMMNRIAMLSDQSHLAMLRAPSARGASLLLLQIHATPLRTPSLSPPLSSSAPTLPSSTRDNSSNKPRPLWKRHSRSLTPFQTDLSRTCQDSTDITKNNSLRMMRKLAMLLAPSQSASATVFAHGASLLPLLTLATQLRTPRLSHPLSSSARHSNSHPSHKFLCSTNSSTE